MSETNGSGKRDEAKFDGVVNELRNVLSGLGRTPPPADRGPFDEPAAPSDPLLSSPFVDAPPASGEPLATDADFWNGNVLGWPSNADADLPEVPPAMPAAEPAAQANGFVLDDDAPPPSNGFAAPPKPAAPALFQPLDEDPSASAFVAPDPQPLVAAEIPEPPSMTPPVPQPIEQTPEAWPLIKDDAEDIVPQAPPAPAAAQPGPAEAAPAAAATPPASAPTADPWLHAGMGMDAPFIDPKPEPAAPAAAPAAAAAGAPGAELEFELPIPGTKETKDKPAADQGPALDLEGTDLKPADLAQVACVYPAGQEKAGQAFVNKLREAAEKLRAPLNVQAVFVSSWAPDKIDPASWAKSTQLSGADSMFVLSFRASAGLFKNLAADTAGKGAKARLVLLEQVNFPTLYADILVELRRGR